MIPVSSHLLLLKYELTEDGGADAEAEGDAQERGEALQERGAST